MDLTKDDKLDVAYVRFRRGKDVRTVEIRPGVLLDLDKNGQILGIEVLSLSELAPALAGTAKKKRTRKRA
jgi:uncharacterized protein YuzE